MRFRLFYSAFIFISSCSRNDNSGEILKFSQTDFPQTWKLSSINAGLSGETFDAEEISTNEIYVFNENGTFSKKFEDQFAKRNAKGIFDRTTLENRDFLILTYEFDIDSLSYCSMGNLENLLISENKQMLSNGDCVAFDGPAMYYVRIE